MASIEKIISGGQTGVDRAALDVALELEIACGGWCPKFRRAEDGRIPPEYPLIEASSTNYAERTALNVRDSDGTLILALGELSRGTALTRDMTRRYGRPCLIVDLREEVDLPAVEQWLEENKIRTLNVAGPRESQSPGIHAKAVNALRSLFQAKPARASGRKPRSRSTKPA